ncbi:MAG: HDOD domain-containing protein, partial [Hyphomicrobiales bacterium]
MAVDPVRGTGRARSREDVLAAVEAIPPLPAVAFRVMQVAQDARSSAADLATVVATDPGLTSAVLRAANSAAYHRMREVRSVQEALVMLGFEQARDIAMSTAIAGSYAPNALDALFRIEAFWRHSIAVAFRAAAIAGESRASDAGAAFTAGILHDMGRLAMFYADPAGVDQAVAAAIARGEPFDALEHELLGYRHTEVGWLLAERWGLPADIRDAIGMHHHAAALSVPGLAGVVAAADQYCVARGVLPGYLAARPETPAEDAAFDRLMTRVD